MSKKGGGHAIYTKIAEKLIASDWDSVFNKLDASSKKKLFIILDEKKQILKKRKQAAEKKSASRSSKIRAGKSEQKEDLYSHSRSGGKITYNFGSRKLHIWKPSKYPDQKTAQRPVEGKLKLFYAHGYSGNFEDSRQNMYLSRDGKMLIYYIAAVVIVFDYKANKQRFFTKHNDDITTICLSPNKPYCASGQKDPKDEPGQGKDLPKIYVWNYKSMKSMQLIDNVCWGKISRLQWSPSSNYLYCICGDDGQTLKAYDSKQFGKKAGSDTLIDASTMREVILGFEINPAPSANNVDEFLLFGKRKFGYCYITKGNKGLQAKLKNVSIVSLKKDGEKSFACGQFLNNGTYLVGSASGAIYVGKENTALAIISGHDKAIGAMCINKENVLTAGSDKKFKIWKVGQGKGKGKTSISLKNTWQTMVEVKESDVVLKPRAIAYNAASGTVFCGTKTNQIVQFEMKTQTASVLVDGHDGQVWGLCTSPTHKLFATGGYDNAVKVWNANNMKCIATYEFENGKFEFCCGHWSNKGDILVFGTEDSNLAVFAWRQKRLKLVKVINIPPKNANAEIEGVSYLRFSNDSSLLAAAHMDANLYIFSVTGIDSNSPDLKKWSTGMNHSAAPTNVQFTENGKIVKTLTRDYEIAHWTLDKKAKKGKFLAVQPDPDTTKWADDPLIAGWDTQGLYQRGWDGTDLNDATITSDCKLIASGDDYGCVRLHNFPAVDPSACLEYRGHAEFVVGVEFLRDDSQLITCGGADMAIFQWKLIK